MSSSASEVQVLVDDFDPRITYTPADGWRTMGSDTEFNSTTHALLEGTGSFNGTGIAVYGTLAVESGDQLTVTFILDDGTPMSYSPDSRDLRYRTRFFQSPVLEDGEHTLLMVDAKADARSFILVSSGRFC
ncbi:hypothetical protein BDV98DRAFT_509456 [Pterulicium gracile]|uniref:Uncharacterized protein n=1 Tax=Pterulicium gracile TaxID=1884261 RepID=A0A5C3QFA8_9AGAR|nr:hypothetical protein BDV98DRAFT_509456 [Pterula gracilis]